MSEFIQGIGQGLAGIMGFSTLFSDDTTKLKTQLGNINTQTEKLKTDFLFHYTQLSNEMQAQNVEDMLAMKSLLEDEIDNNNKGLQLEITEVKFVVGMIIIVIFAMFNFILFRK